MGHDRDHRGVYGRGYALRYDHDPVKGTAYYDPADYTQALVENMIEGRTIALALAQVPNGAAEIEIEIMEDPR
jgi:hypothetical protein